MQKRVFFPGLFAYVDVYRFNAEKFQYAVFSDVFKCRGGNRKIIF